MSQSLLSTSEEATPQCKRNSTERLSSDSIHSDRLRSAKRVRIEQREDKYNDDNDDDVIFPPPKKRWSRTTHLIK